MTLSRRHSTGAETLDRSSSDKLGSTDELFAALDGQVISSRGCEWELRIFGIYPDIDQAWLQVRLSGPEEIDAVVAVDAQPAAALRVIRGGLDRHVFTSFTPHA